MELLAKAKARVVDNNEKQGFLAAFSAAVFESAIRTPYSTWSTSSNWLGLQRKNKTDND